ncbi:hypothetical protein EON78_03005 [bacterium]|nr:MAG: hypothetical protein EON78_03005 [bacterium]
MTIKGLSKLIKCHKDKMQISAFSNKTLAIDTMSFLYKSNYAVRKDQEKKRNNNHLSQYPYLLNFHYLLKLFKKHNIKPIFVIDGQKLRIKYELYSWIQQQKKIVPKPPNKPKKKSCPPNQFKHVTTCQIHNLIDYLRNKNAEIIIAPYEADAQIAFLCKHKIADLPLTDDSDILNFGCHKFISNLSIKTGNCQYFDLDAWRNKIDKVTANTTFHTLLSLEKHEFFYAMILSGCDYFAPFPGKGICTILPLFKQYSTFPKVLRHIFEESQWDLAYLPYIENDVIFSSYSFRYQLIYDDNLKGCRSLQQLPTNLSQVESILENWVYIGQMIKDVKSFSEGDLHLKNLSPRPRDYTITSAKIFAQLDNTILICPTRSSTCLEKRPGIYPLASTEFMGKKIHFEEKKAEEPSTQKIPLPQIPLKDIFTDS